MFKMLRHNIGVVIVSMKTISDYIISIETMADRQIERETPKRVSSWCCN
jgi:hypothetical protein